MKSLGWAVLGGIAFALAIDIWANLSFVEIVVAIFLLQIGALFTMKAHDF